MASNTRNDNPLVELWREETEAGDDYMLRALRIYMDDEELYDLAKEAPRLAAAMYRAGMFKTP